MLDIAQQRCPQAQFYLQDMSEFTVNEPVDLITCFLYSIHYNKDINKLKECLARVHESLKPQGIFCFNAVDKTKIDNDLFVSHSVAQAQSQFTFRSGWHYGGSGDQQSLQLSIGKVTGEETQVWHDEHPMVAVSFAELTALLTPYFEVHIFEHDYEKIIPWDKSTGNALFICVKI